MIPAVLRAALWPPDWRLAALVAAAGLVAAALFHPTVPGAGVQYRYLWVFDITQSMNVPDTGPAQAPSSRLDYAKQAALGVLQRLPCGSQVGVGIFTAHRSFPLFKPVEICTHYAELRQVIKGLDWRMAWRARSEVAKGLYSGIRVAGALGAGTALVFFTDGHEAPPVNPTLRPRFGGQTGAVKGVIVGVGADAPVPIPKLDRQGRVTGYWGPGEVMQVDVYTYGRPAAGGREAMVGQAPAPRPRAPGTEHLSYLHEGYLKRLAAERSFAYLRLEGPEGLTQLLTRAALASPKETARDLRGALGALALLALCAVYLVGPRIYM